MIGTTLAHYQITALLGRGGMGEVYQATDSKLGRSVAIKLLPEAFSHDEDRSIRFEREARALASLNDPHVAAIYGVEESAGRKFLIMELVDGETLAERIARGAIPVEEALGIAIQILQAMEAAHEKGIVHRDLKPANIKVTSDGNVKVLDFGLAKAFETESPTPRASESPTFSMAATAQGIILGTPAYMSPEQAKSRAVDRRADIFAFGAVLYEMLTGRRAFEGEDVQDILGSVLKIDPDWSRLPTDVPTGIHTLLRLCLQKDARKRRQTATDVRIDIEETAKESSPPAASALPVRKSRERIAFATAAIALLAVAGLLATNYFAPAPTPALASRFLIELPPEALILPGTIASPFPTVSPDGRYVVFQALSEGVVRLWLRPIGSLTAQPIPGTDGINPVSTPLWSAKSDFIGFFAAGKLKKVAIAGGPPEPLCDAAGDAIAGTWSPNDTILFESSGSIYRVGGAGGTPTAVRTPDKNSKSSSYKFPSFLPDGRHFLYIAAGSNPEARVADLDSADDKPLFATNSRVLFAAPGYLLFVRDGTLMAQPFDAKKLALAGDVLPVAEDVAFNAANGTGAFSSSANGTLVYRSGSAATFELTKFDRSGNNLGVIRANGNFIHPRLSPDKNSLLVEKMTGGKMDIWIIDLSRGTATPVTTNPADEIWPIFSDDGKQIAFASDREGTWGIYTKPVNGASPEELIHKVEGSAAYINSWSSEFLIYETISLVTGRDVWALPMTGDRKAFPVVTEKSTQMGSRLSPDGRWILYASNESGRYEIFVQAFPKSTGPRQISVDGVAGTGGNWGGGGKEIIYQAIDGKMMAVSVTLDASIEATIPKELFRLSTNVPGQRFAMSSDSQLFVFPLAPPSVDRPALTTVLNWTAEIKK